MINLKRGVSAVVASVLLILLVIVIASIIFAFARGFVQDKIDDSSRVGVEQCDGLDLGISVVDINGISRKLDVVNRGSVNISFFEFKVFYKDGSSILINSTLGVLSGASITREVDFVNVNFTNVENIEVYPVLGNGSNMLVCDEEDIYLIGY